MLREGLQFVRENPQDVARIDSLLRLITESHVFTRQQGLMLAAIARDFAPQVILDLGTARGNSASALAIGQPDATLYTFDMEPHWHPDHRSALEASGPCARIRPVIADLTKIDFAPLITGTERIMLFWDAHGFDIAEHVLGHVLPLIADKRHIIVTHDITDNRAHGGWRSYKGRRMWRGQEDFYRNPGTRAYLNIGHLEAHVDQFLPLLDFCNRNDLALHTVDEEVYVAGRAEEWRAAINGDGLGSALFHLCWFSMNETEHRYFPAYEIRARTPESDKPTVKLRQETTERGVLIWRHIVGAGSLLESAGRNALAPRPNLSEDPVLSRFSRWRGVAPAGMDINFLGQLTRLNFVSGWAERRDGLRTRERYCEIEYPPLSEETFEWLLMLSAVLEAREHFVMIEAGGRIWTVARRRSTRHTPSTSRNAHQSHRN